MKNLRNNIENNLTEIANNLKTKGLFTTIQIILYGNQKNAAPRETTFN